MLSLTMCPTHFLVHSIRFNHRQASAAPIKTIEKNGGLEFPPLIFDYLRRKYDIEHKKDDKKHTDTVMPYTRHLSSTQ